jgi:Holliday junction resolvase-like predicted endonuclease
MYEVKILCGGPGFSRILGPFERRSQAEAHAIDWFNERGYEVIDREVDAENDAIDMIAARNGALYQFAIEKAR